jgi:hypothetical protein
VKSVGLVALLLAFMLVLVGCPTTKPSSTSDTETAPVVSEPPEPTGEPEPETAESTEEPEAPAETETHPTAKVAVLKVGDEFDEETEKITNQTKTFTPDTPIIYVSAGIKGLEKGEMVKGTLMAVDVTAKDGTEISDVEVASRELEAPAEESTMDWKFSAPTEGWPPGSYQVEIEGSDKPIETVELTVEEAGS